MDSADGRGEGSPDAARIPDQTFLAQVLPTGEVETRYSGPRETGELGAEGIAQLLVAVLRSNGEQWGEVLRPEGQEQGVDFEAVGPNGRLRLQITRLPHSGSFWKELNTTGAAVRAATVADASDEIIRAIRSKAMRIPPVQRRSITLVLDATRFLEFEVEATMRDYYERFGSEAIEFQFEDILLVGVTKLRGLASPDSLPLRSSVA